MTLLSGASVCLSLFGKIEIVNLTAQFERAHNASELEEVAPDAKIAAPQLLCDFGVKKSMKSYPRDTKDPRPCPDSPKSVRVGPTFRFVA